MRRLTLAPFGVIPADALQAIAGALERTFAVEVRTPPPLPEPQQAFDPGRGQWLATEFVKTLLAQTASQADWVLGVTERDLFVPVLSFVFGQAQLRGQAAVVSLARLRPEYFGLPPEPAILATRAAKEAVHETGHLLGLVHCQDRLCPMSLSIGLEDLDHKTAVPCQSCAALLEGSLSMLPIRAQSPPPAGDSQ